MVYLLGYNGIDTSDGGNVHDVTYRAFDVGEMNRFVQSHLNRADDFRFTHVLDELVKVFTSFPFRRVNGYFSSRN